MREISAQRKLASNTERTHRARLLEKTGTQNDVVLALFALVTQPQHASALKNAGLSRKA